ncbi:hypothetical protein ACFW04_013707 [Cataglyphis niger]
MFKHIYGHSSYMFKHIYIYIYIYIYIHIYIYINSDKVKIKRTTEVKFAVGMIVRLFNSYNGVIIGWHNKCDNLFLNKVTKPFLLREFLCFEFNHFCQCKKFSSDAYQQHYILLTENNEISYAQQDQLSICPPKKINHMEIGRYFSSFAGTHYIPNESLKEEYPEDIAAITRILAKQ